MLSSSVQRAGLAQQSRPGMLGLESNKLSIPSAGGSSSQSGQTQSAGRHCMPSGPENLRLTSR